MLCETGHFQNYYFYNAEFVYCFMFHILHVVFGMIKINIALLVLALAPPLTNFKELDSDHLGLGEDKVWSV